MHEVKLRHERHPRALVVDDEELVRGLLARATAEAGCEVATAASVDQALALLRADPDIDLLVTDCAMPARSGLNSSKKCAKTARTFRASWFRARSRETSSAAAHGSVSTCFAKPTGWQELERVLEGMRDGDH